MLQQNTSALAPAPLRPGENPADRRAHPRIPSAKLPVTRVHIPNRATVSLVDLSAGGALLQLPFQMPPESRFAVKLDTAVEQLEVPFQLLRCYVAELNGGVTYHAAGVFDNLLNIQGMAERASTSAQRLLGTLVRLQRSVRRVASSRTDEAFSEVLNGAITWLRRGESIDLVTLKVKAHLTQTYPSLVIVPSVSSRCDHVASVQAFGLTFTSRYALSVHDRRLLKAAAQLISVLEDTQREMREESDADTHAPQVIRSAADWIAAHPRAPYEERRPRLDPAAVVTEPDRGENAWKAIESMILKAAVL